MKRGTFNFEVTEHGNLVNNAKNVEKRRSLWLDRSIVQGYYFGPGDAGDFDYGAWHVACHLVAAGVRCAQVDISCGLRFLTTVASDYFANVTVRTGGIVHSHRLDSAEGRELLADALVLGFVEGNSRGRISARGVYDSPGLFNLWPRQDFDQPVGCPDDGGKVWEHWCTLRDIHPTSRIGMSVLTASVSLASVLGDQFASAVARGRRDYGHPDQLRALVLSGFTTKNSALWDTKAVEIPAEAEQLFLPAESVSSLEAVEKLDWSKPPCYYMFARRIKGWST